MNLETLYSTYYHFQAEASRYCLITLGLADTVGDFAVFLSGLSIPCNIMCNISLYAQMPHEKFFWWK